MSYSDKNIGQQLNICSDNNLLPDDAKPLSEQKFWERWWKGQCSGPKDSQLTFDGYIFAWRQWVKFTQIMLQLQWQ